MGNKKTETTVINFGPQHPSSHGVLRILLELDGELINRIEPEIGQLHRGTEKLIEYKTYLQNIPFFDRLDYVSPINYEHAWVLSIEKLLNCEVPERASYLRMIVSEMSRIGKAIFTISTLGVDLGATTPMLWGFEIRELMMEVFENISGGRLHMNYIRPGGVFYDMDSKIEDKIINFMDKTETILSDIQSLISENRIFKQRTVSIGVVDKTLALDYGFSGPNLRASGIAWDLRKKQPYELYRDIDFNVPVGSSGDCYDRYSVRVFEIYESINIIKQCLNKMKPGPIRNDNYKVSIPPRDRMKSSMETMIHHFKLFSEGIFVPEGEAYVPVETPSGEFGVYLISQGDYKPYRAKLRSNSFAHLQIISKLMQNYQLADLPAVLGSLDIVFGEVDR